MVPCLVELRWPTHNVSSMMGASRVSWFSLTLNSREGAGLNLAARILRRVFSVAVWIGIVFGRQDAVKE